MKKGRGRKDECCNPKKIPAHLYATTRMKYEAIEANSSKFKVKKMCQVLGLKAPNYYRWKNYRDKCSVKRDQEFRDIKRIEDIFLKSDKIYGYRTIARQLERDGYPMSEYRIRRIMSKNGFYPETKKKYRPTHKGKTDGKYSENILKQNFKASKRNHIWVGDITYIKTAIGCVFLAVVIDLYNREVIGYSVSKKIDTNLVKSALANAIVRQGTGDNLVFHSDRGCQYSSKDFHKMLKDNGM